MTVSAPATVHVLELVVSRWFDAFNARDLDAMLVGLDLDVDFHPLRLHGLDGAYRGHDGVRGWFEGLGRLGHEHRIALAEVQAGDADRVLASGALRIGDDANAAPFCAVHQVGDGLILSAHHYLSDRDMLERLGRVRKHNAL